MFCSRAIHFASDSADNRHEPTVKPRSPMFHRENVVFPDLGGKNLTVEVADACRVDRRLGSAQRWCAVDHSRVEKIEHDPSLLHA